MSTPGSRLDAGSLKAMMWGIVCIVFVIVAWILVGLIVGAPAQLPLPWNVMQTLWLEAVDGELLGGLSSSLSTLVLGLLLASVAAPLVSLLLGRIAVLRPVVLALAMLLGLVPAIALTPLLIVWKDGPTGLGVVLVFYSSFWVLLVRGLRGGFANTSSTPVATRTAWRSSWAALLAYEMFLATFHESSGLGWYLIEAMQFADTSRILTGIAAVTAIGLLGECLGWALAYFRSLRGSSRESGQQPHLSESQLRHRISLLLTALLLLLVVWELTVRLGNFDPLFLPSPTETAAVLWQRLGEFFGPVLTLLLLLAFSLAVASIASSSLRLLTGRFRGLNRMVYAVARLALSLPAIVLFPFAVMIAGIGESLLVIPAWAACWPLIAGRSRFGVHLPGKQNRAEAGWMRRLLCPPNLKEAGWAALNGVVSTELLIAAVTPRVRGPGWLLFESFYDLEVTMLFGVVFVLMVIALPLASVKDPPEL